MKVSLITVSYNSVQTIEDTIQSVIKQTYSNIEFIVIDGGSNDGTQNIIRNYQRNISVFITEPDLGIYDGMNKGISKSTGDIVGFINSDDVLSDPFVISDIVNSFGKDIEVVYGDKTYVSRSDLGSIRRVWKPGDFSRERYRTGWMTPHLSTYIRRSIYDEIGKFRLDLDIAADYELMLRALYIRATKVKYLPRNIVKMRTGGISNSSFWSILKSNYQAYRSWGINGMTISPFIFLLKPFRKILQIRIGKF